MDEAVVRVVTRAIDKVKRELEHHSDVERKNALLSLMADGLVLPSPAVALMQVKCDNEVSFSPTAFFRSVDPVGDIGEVILSAMSAGITIAPWSLEDVRLMKDSTGVVHGIELELLRPDSSDPPPVLLFHPPDVPLLGWGLVNAVWQSDDGEVELADPLPNSQRGVGRAEIATLSILENLCSSLIQFNLSRLTRDRESILLRGNFIEPIELVGVSGPELKKLFKINVFPVWSALPCVYPAFDRFEANVSGHYNKRLHPLTTESLGEGWTACRVSKVRLARRQDRVFPSETGTRRNYELCVVPQQLVQFFSASRFELIPSVMLARDVVEEVDSLNDRVVIDFVATRGSASNGVQPGTRFRLIDGHSGADARVSGEMLSATIGGSDGMLGAEHRGDMAVLLGGGQQRTVEEVLEFTNLRFGDSLSIVDPADLTRPATGGSVNELRLRVSVKAPYRDRLSRRAIVAAYNEALDAYCRPNDVGPIVVVDEMA